MEMEKIKQIKIIKSSLKEINESIREYAKRNNLKNSNAVKKLIVLGFVFDKNRKEIKKNISYSTLKKSFFITQYHTL